ncbi:MAG: hypothetical protein ABUL58_06905, partial [Steroidobacter sp.]
TELSGFRSACFHCHPVKTILRWVVVSLWCRQCKSGYALWHISRTPHYFSEETMMKLQKQTIADVESTLNYLLGVLSSAKKGDRRYLDGGAYKYAREVLEAAEQPLRALGMYEVTEHAINESERLILAGHFDEADNLLLSTGREMLEKSGSNDRLRKMYTPKASERKQ